MSPIHQPPHGHGALFVLGAADPECTTLRPCPLGMQSWAPAQHLVDIYGDPVRGFAGAYVVAAGHA